MAITIEFWRSGTNVYVGYDNQKLHFSEFLKIPESKIIMEKMYHKIARDFPLEDDGEMLSTVGKFINNHFMDFDKTYDVVILGKGRNEKVIFNLER